MITGELGPDDALHVPDVPGAMTVEHAEVRPGPPSVRPAPPWWQSRRAVFALLTLAVLVPLVVIAITFITNRDFFATGDLGITEFQVRDVGAHTPLVGPYSRFGWNHPGPMMYWLMAAPYRLVGSSSGLVAGAVLIAGSAAAGSLVLAWRRGGRLLTTLVAGALLAFTIAHVSILASPWNPYIGLVPFFLVVLAAWSLTLGDRVALPLLLAGAAVATQSHLSFAIPIGLVSAWGIGFLLWQWRKPEARRGWRTSLLVSAAVVVVTWTPVLIQQLTNSPGNLSELLTYSRSAGRDPLGASLAVKLGATSFLPWGSLSMPESQAFTTKGSPLLLLVPLAALGTILIIGRRRHRRDLLLLAVTLAAVLVSGVAALTSVDGAPYIYLYTWIWISSLTLWTGFAWAVALELQARTAPRVRDVVRVASLGLVVLLCGWACVRAATLENPADSIPAANTAMATIIPQVEGAIPAGASVSIASSGSGIGHRAALAVALEETGHRFVVPPGEGYVYGSHRVGDPAATDTRLVIGLGSVVDKLEATTGLTRIASWNPLSTAERKERAQLSADLSAQLKAVGRADVVAKLATSEGLADLKTVKGLDRDQLSRLSQLVKAERTKVAVFEDTRPTSSS